MTPSTHRSAVAPTERPACHGAQVYDQVNDDQLHVDAVGTPLPHLSAQQHATGEAVYVDDMPSFTGAIRCRVKNEIALICAKLGADLRGPIQEDLRTILRQISHLRSSQDNDPIHRTLTTYLKSDRSCDHSRQVL